MGVRLNRKLELPSSERSTLCADRVNAVTTDVGRGGALVSKTGAPPIFVQTLQGVRTVTQKGSRIGVRAIHSTKLPKIGAQSIRYRWRGGAGMNDERSCVALVFGARARLNPCGALRSLISE
jgi:hypothetical protein